jgi:hypothetical protein
LLLGEESSHCLSLSLGLDLSSKLGGSTVDRHLLFLLVSFDSVRVIQHIAHHPHGTLNSSLI